MAKTGTLNLRVDDSVKSAADDILKRLGIPMSTAIDMFLNQIILTGVSHLMFLYLKRLNELMLIT